MPAKKPKALLRQKQSSRVAPPTLQIIKRVADEMGDGQGKALDRIVAEWLLLREDLL